MVQDYLMSQYLGYKYGQSVARTTNPIPYDQDSYNDVNDYLYQSDYKGVTAQDAAKLAYNLGYINESDYKIATKYYNSYTSTKRDPNDTPADIALHDVGDFFKKYGYKFSEALSDILPTGKNSSKDAAAIERVNDAITKVYLKDPNIYDNAESAAASIYGSGPAAPRYAAQINPNEGTIDVDPLYWWRGKEMADLYNLDYDVDTYYNLIKKGTEAAVQAQEFINDQNNQASLRDNTVLLNDYLNTLSDSKATAAIKGSTLGARMANELLQNTNTSSDYANSQYQVANQAINDINSLLDANAKARVTATNYFRNSVVQPVIDNIESFYYDDVNRRGAQLNTNADIYAANQNYNSQVMQANAAANAAYNTAKTNYNNNVNDYILLYNAFVDQARTQGYNDKASYVIAQNKVNNWLINN